MGLPSYTMFPMYCVTDVLIILCILDELSDLRGQVKLLEDKNTKYMQENLEIQEV